MKTITKAKRGRSKHQIECDGPQIILTDLIRDAYSDLQGNCLTLNKSLKDMLSITQLATILKSKAAHATLSPKVSNENILKSKDPETYSLIDAIDDHLRVIAHNTDVWENARKNFFKEMTQLTDYVSNFVTENSDLAKMRPKKYSKALTSKINSITPTYDNYNNIYEVWKKFAESYGIINCSRSIFDFMAVPWNFNSSANYDLVMNWVSLIENYTSNLDLDISNNVNELILRSPSN
jgi:hypothetical protein